MSRISKSEKYAILWLHSQGHNIEDISKEINIDDLSKIKRIIGSSQSKNIDTDQSHNVIKTTSEPVKQKTPFQNLMINNSTSGKNNVSIMTKDASSITDKKITKSNTENSAIFRINK